MLAVAASAVALASAALGDEGRNRFRGVLSGYQEVVGPGPISTVGSGVVSLTIDEAAMTIGYTLTYTLENPATQAHIHFGQRAVGGGVIAFLCGGGGKPTCPSPGGTVTGVIVPADVIGPANQGIEAGSFGEAVRAIRAGAVYANVHSTRWGAGEIRAQLTAGDGD
jgi:hypothetical protein